MLGYNTLPSRSRQLQDQPAGRQKSPGIVEIDAMLPLTMPCLPSQYLSRPVIYTLNYAPQDRRYCAICIDEICVLRPEIGEHPFKDLVLVHAEQSLMQALMKTEIGRFEPSGNENRTSRGEIHSLGSIDTFDARVEKS